MTRNPTLGRLCVSACQCANTMWETLYYCICVAVSVARFGLLIVHSLGWCSFISIHIYGYGNARFDRSEMAFECPLLGLVHRDTSVV